jgi:dihydrofolate reductase
MTTTQEAERVSATVLSMSMSLDGFIAGPRDGNGNGLGDGGGRLHEWLFAGGGADAGSGVPTGPPGVNGDVYAELMATGAVVVGRRTFDIANGWGGDHHGVPILVLTRRPPDDAGDDWPLVSYVTDVETAMARAKDAAGDRDVLVHGARTAQLALAAGVLDELEIHQIPVLLGQGRRLFDGLGPEHMELELTRIVDGAGVTHLRYRVQR